MCATFDPHDKNSWFFGPMSRQEAIDLLRREAEPGVFLVRNSNSIAGDLVLCVREETRVSHYIIHNISEGSQTRFKIGEQMFSDMPSLLQFYSTHFLDTSPLVRPAAKQVERVRARFDFNGSGDTDDLPFRRGEVLTIISKDEEQWWTARNSVGQIGQIPVNYIERLDDSGALGSSTSGALVCGLGGATAGGPLLNGGGSGIVHLPPPTTNPPAPPQSLLPSVSSSNNGCTPLMTASGVGPTGANSSSASSTQIRYTTPQLGGSGSPASLTLTSNGGQQPAQPVPALTANGLQPLAHQQLGGCGGITINGQRNSQERKLPAKARVKQARVPNAYDKTALRLDIGDIILVTAMHKNGQWEGELRGKTGHFPFTHVEFIDSGDEEEP